MQVLAGENVDELRISTYPCSFGDIQVVARLVIQIF